MRGFIVASFALRTWSVSAWSCPDTLDAVFADMHDGDKKKVTISGSTLTIQPSGNDQHWKVHAELDRTACSAIVDFNVHGKPSPPPVNLLATLWRADAAAGQAKTTFEFTDPSGTLADKAAPLNQWVQVDASGSGASAAGGFECPQQAQGVFADMHDGDKKVVKIADGKMSITPSGSTQSWSVVANLNHASCSASVDFRVPGKPSPPPFALSATLWRLESSHQTKLSFEFTNPSGATPAATLNAWIDVSGAAAAQGDLASAVIVTEESAEEFSVITSYA